MGNWLREMLLIVYSSFVHAYTPCPSVPIQTISCCSSLHNAKHRNWFLFFRIVIFCCIKPDKSVCLESDENIFIIQDNRTYFTVFLDKSSDILYEFTTLRGNVIEVPCRIYGNDLFIIIKCILNGMCMFEIGKLLDFGESDPIFDIAYLSRVPWWLIHIVFCSSIINSIPDDLLFSVSLWIGNSMNFFVSWSRVTEFPVWWKQINCHDCLWLYRNCLQTHYDILQSHCSFATVCSIPISCLSINTHRQFQ